MTRLDGIPNGRLLFALLAALLLFAASAQASVVVYHDPGADDALLGNLLANLCFHFDADVAVRPVQGYRAGDLNGFDVALYVGAEDDPALPHAFLVDVGTGSHRVFWINGNLDQLTTYLGGSGSFGFRFKDWNTGEGRNRILYKGRSIVRDAADLSFFEVQVTGTVETYSTIAASGTPGDTKPHCLRGGNLTYLVENPLYFVGLDDRYFVLADLLHEVFQTGIEDGKLAMVRLEDLSPAADHPTALAQVGRTLAAMDVPFSFGVIPLFTDPAPTYYPRPTKIALSNAALFVAAIKSMIGSGGTILMHGYTHQHGTEVSGDGWEFLDGADLDPLPEDGEAWVRGRIESGLRLFARQGLRPQIWETPHYGASQGAYAVVADYFATAYERPFVYDLPPGAGPHWGYHGARSGQVVPYFLPASVNGTAVLPETMGYYDPSAPGGSVDDLLAIADGVSIIRDGVASFFFHPTEFDPAILYQIVQGLLDRGYAFVGPDYFLGARTDPWIAAPHAGDDDGEPAVAKADIAIRPAAPVLGPACGD